jgi:ribosomal protein S18 acetylase RimI-like enzyme
MVKKGCLAELDEILALTRACGQHMRAQGIDQWDENYPDRESLHRDLSEGSLFVYSEENALMGIVVLNEKQDEEYAQIKWSTAEADKNLVVHRLAVHPDFQGRGIAQKLMDFAEAYARSKHYSSIRLDTFSQNPRNQRFYRMRGYTELGAVFLKYKKAHPYICYELVF